MSMKKLIIVSCLPVVVLGTFFVSGCDLAQPTNKRPPMDMRNVEVEAPQDPPVQNEPEKKEPVQGEDDTVTVKAEVGVGSKGSSYAKPTGGPMDIITVPIAAHFRARESISFKHIDHAMNLYKAENDGNGPTSHEEFMDKIIRANGIMLPQLFPGQEYMYDPKDGVLKVRKPRNSQ